MSTFITSVRQYCNGEVSDLDSTNNNILSLMASPNTNYGTGCNAKLSGDSWVPSNNQDTSVSTYIACTATSGDVGDATTCTAAFGDSGGTCAGCMDTTILMDAYYPNTGDAATLTTNLNSEYGAGCAFNTQLSNVWSRYYQVKNAKLGPSDTAGTTTVLARSEQAVADVNGTGASTVFTNLNNFQTAVDNI